MPRFLVPLIFSLALAAQPVQVEAPWLTVYDVDGRPRWEVRMTYLARTDEGWEGEGVEVRLFHAGEVAVVIAAHAIRADRFGRAWTLVGDVTGEGEGISFTCDLAQWSGGLVLVGLRATREGMSLVAAEARWALDEGIDLVDVQATLDGWEVKFADGRYLFEGGLLLASRVFMVGHGVVLVGGSLSAWPGEGRLSVRGAYLVRNP
jgi:hypothetical protein